MIRTRVGYAGGSSIDPEYHNLDGHSETLQIDFDPVVISYESILALFWECHDPAYPVRSTQYKSLIFCHSEAQRRAAEKTKRAKEADEDRKMYTEIIDFDTFYRAEDYHQKYMLQHDGTLMGEFRAMYPDFRRFVDSTAAARVNGFLGGYGTLPELSEEIAGYGLSDSSSVRLLQTVKNIRRLSCSRA